jgi:hypothetical protein
MSMHDLRPHVDMWHSFIKLITYSIGGIIVILGGMALFLL